MANLHFKYGTMSASKSADLIIQAYNLRQNGINVECLKPTFDNRFSSTTIKSRIGIETPALSLNSLQFYKPQYNTKVIMVDEVQFFTPNDIDILVNIVDNQGKIVMCYGLLVDYNGNMFPTSKRLIESGAKLHQIKTNCQIKGCTNLADHHLLFTSDGQVVRGGTGVQLGDILYKSVCRQHFNKIYNDGKQK